jgi:hypothetical protein
LDLNPQSQQAGGNPEHTILEISVFHIISVIQAILSFKKWFSNFVFAE